MNCAPWATASSPPGRATMPKPREQSLKDTQADGPYNQVKGDVAWATGMVTVVGKTKAGVAFALNAPTWESDVFEKARYRVAAGIPHRPAGASVGFIEYPIHRGTSSAIRPTKLACILSIMRRMPPTLLTFLAVYSLLYAAFGVQAWRRSPTSYYSVQVQSDLWLE